MNAKVSAEALRASLGGPLPDAGLDPVEIITALARDAEPELTATSGPRFFGFVIGGSLHSLRYNPATPSPPIAPVAAALPLLMPSTTQDTARRSTMTALFVSAGLSSSGYIAAIIVAPLVAEDLLGSTTWSGLPSAMTVVGMAVGSTALATLMARRGRRAGLLLGYGIVTVGAGLAALATQFASFTLFNAGMFTLGAGHSANRLTRYAASDLYSSAHRASAISWILWAGTIGSILGPALLEPARSLAWRVGIEGSTGPFFVTISGAICAVAVLRGLMPPLRTATTAAPGAPVSRGGTVDLLALPNVQIALVALVISQGVMVLLMTMTPVHIREAGGTGFGAIGLVIGAHAFGMYALSPLTGLLADRIGRIPIILTGVAMLIASTFLAADAGGGDMTRLTSALLLLGLGWNFGFVAGSALLTDSVPESDCVRLQGLADSAVWMTGAAASLGSGLLLATWGYPVLSFIGTALSFLPVLAIGRHRLVPRASHTGVET